MDRTVFIVPGLLLLAASSIWLAFRASPATCSDPRWSIPKLFQCASSSPEGR